MNPRTAPRTPVTGHGIATAPGATFSTRQITPLRHTFHRHPALQLPALRDLARRLHPQGRCRFIRPGAQADSAFWHDARAADGRDVDAVFDRIADPGAWIALYHVESDPAYAALLDEVMATVRDQVEREQPGVFGLSGFVFISAPPSVTPFHIDRENNFWLQVGGRKRLQVWDHRDRETVTAEAVERFVVSGDLDAVRLTEAARSRGQVFDVGPGEGVYWPSTSPHLTSTSRDDLRDGADAADGVSVSLGVCFYTLETRRQARIHQTNRLLRRLGLRPGSPGSSTLADRLKAAIGPAAAVAQARLAGRPLPTGSF